MFLYFKKLLKYKKESKSNFVPAFDTDKFRKTIKTIKEIKDEIKKERE